MTAKINTRGKVLVFGGNGFLGGETVRHMLEESFQVTTVCRGRTWDWACGQTIKPFVNWIKHDRRKPLRECIELSELVDHNTLDVVVDFSGYDKFAVEECATFFHGKINMYIFISTDSVYEVCQEKTYCRATKEEDAVRPPSKEIQKCLNRQDKYGHKKLCCEEVLHDQRKSGGFPFLILRLADVVGPRDSTDRWWQYQLWIKLAHCTGIPVLIPESLKQVQLSVVYVKDVARLITQLVEHYIKHDNEKKDLIIDQAYNLAFSQTFTVLDLLECIKANLNVKNVSFQFSPSENVPHIYPSVERGPVDIRKAKKLLLWDPTPWEMAVKETVSFYEEVLKDTNLLQERKDIFEVLLEDMCDLFPVNTLVLKTLLHL